MKAFNNFGTNEEYQPIVRLSNGKYLVNFNKKEQLQEEMVMRNSKYVGSGNMLPTGFASWESIIFDSKPSISLIKDTIFEIIDRRVSYAIVNSFRWNGYNINLSMENQMNYKRAFDLAVSTNGESLPVTFKFSKSNKVEYYTFDTLEELKNFYLEIDKYINSCLNKGWKEKDKIDFSVYKI